MIWHGKLEDFIKAFAESGEKDINFLINTCRGQPVRKAIYKLYLEDGTYISFNTYTQWLATIKYMVDLNEGTKVNVDKCIRELSLIEPRILTRSITVEFLYTSSSVTRYIKSIGGIDKPTGKFVEIIDTSGVTPQQQEDLINLPPTRPSNKVELAIPIPKAGVVSLDNIVTKFGSKGKKLKANEAKMWLRKVCKERGFAFVVKDAKGVKKILQELREWVVMTKRTQGSTNE